MYLICMEHILWHGGVLWTVQDKVSHGIAWFFYVIAYCAVNCFGLISGYVGCTSSFKPRNLIRLWLQAVFYSFGISLVFKLISPDTIDLRELGKSLFPICMERYWYLTAYALIFFITPQMNFLLCNQDKKRLRHFIWIFFAVFSILAMIPMLEHIASPIKNGYSAIWLAYLYMVGGFIRLYGVSNLFPGMPMLVRQIKSKQNRMICFFSTFIFCISLTFLLYSVGHLILIRYLGRDLFCRQYLNYNSPTLTLAAISLIVLFAHMNVNRIKKLIRIASPMTFGVYLIHEQGLVRAHFIKGAFGWTAELPIWLLPFVIIFIPLVIYISCSLIDYVRLRLFKLFHLT